MRGGIDDPAAVDLNGFEFGASALNPYEGFRNVRPSAFIQDGIFVFDGKFRVPQASALSHVQRSAELLQEKQVDGALAEAQTAETLTPGELRAELAMEDVLAAAGRKVEARAHYARALAAAKALTGGASGTWVPAVQKAEAKL